MNLNSHKLSLSPHLLLVELPWLLSCRGVHSESLQPWSQTLQVIPGGQMSIPCLARSNPSPVPCAREPPLSQTK